MASKVRGALSNLLGSARNAGPLDVVLNDTSGTPVSVGGGTQYTEGDADTTITGTAVLFEGPSNTLTVASTVTPLPVEIIGAGPGGSTLVTVRQSSAGDLLATVSPSGGFFAVKNSTAADLLATVSPSAGSTWAVRPIQSSAADLQVTATPSGGFFAVKNSSVGDFLASVKNSSAADFLATVTPTAGSTWAVRPIQSSAADLQVTATPAGGSTWNVRALQSSAADLKTTAFNADGSGNLLASDVSIPSTAARGLIVRQAVGGLLTFTSTNAASTQVTVVSSNAASRPYVYAFQLASTVAGTNKAIFFSGGGGGTKLWATQIANSSVGAETRMAVSPPGYLFVGSTGQALTLNLTSSGNVKMSVAYWIST